jgi:hypothetical protein
VDHLLPFVEIVLLRAHGHGEVVWVGGTDRL